MEWAVMEWAVMEWAVMESAEPERALACAFWPLPSWPTSFIRPLFRARQSEALCLFEFPRHVQPPNQSIKIMMLRHDLPGYADYAARVRYRLVPGIW
jgi:hypothetical protein